jgi:DNA polymerase-3 subunit epsilon
LEAEVLELRLIQNLRPRFNRRSKNWSKYVYVKLTLAERFPRLSIVGEPKGDAGFYLGPISSRRDARDVVDAIETVVPLRRCTKRVPRQATAGPCVAAQIGTSVCPCSGEVTEEAYSEIVDDALLALRNHPEKLLKPLRLRMLGLASQQRFEEAADLRRQAFALSTVLRRQYQVEALRSFGRVVFEDFRTGLTTLENGCLVEFTGETGVAGMQRNSLDGVIGKREVAELWCVANWLDAEAHNLRLIYCDHPLSSRYPRLDNFRIKKDLALV